MEVAANRGWWFQVVGAFRFRWRRLREGHENGAPMAVLKNKMRPTNPNAHMYVNGTDVETHGYAVTQNTFLQ